MDDAVAACQAADRFLPVECDSDSAGRPPMMNPTEPHTEMNRQPADDDAAGDERAVHADDAAPRTLLVRPTSAKHDAAAPGPQLPTLVEALLFAADTPLSLARLSEIAQASHNEVRLAIAELNDRYVSNGSSFRVEGIARGYQLLTLPAFQPWLVQLDKQRVQTRISAAALEVLSIIAYKQPIVRADIEAIRGVACGDALSRLRDAGLIKSVGRAEIVGRPLLYGTTRKFLETFGLHDLEALPPLDSLPLRRSLGGEPASEAPRETEAPRRVAAGA
ncbi:MAG: SMC-Scp complex subunit ScpB [Phycisphaerae bacterium]